MAKASTKKVVVAPPVSDPNLLHGIAAATQSGGFQWHSALDVANLLTVGHVEQNPDMRDELGRLATRATPAGIAAHMGQGVPFPLVHTEVPQVAEPNTAPKFAIDNNVVLPEVKRNFGKSTREPTYPFDALPAPVTDVTGRLVYASFHVPATQNEKGEWEQPGRAIGSSLAAQNRKWARETGATKVVSEFIYQQDANGKRVKVDGHYVKVLDAYGNPATQQVEIAITEQEREFTLRTVTETDPRGPGARVFRIK